MSDKTPFSECLGLFRSHCHLTQRSLAQAMKITDGNISKIERGIAPPTMGFVNKMFDALQMEKSGHWYDKFVEALLLTRGKVTFEFGNLKSKQIQLLSYLNTNIEQLDDDTCDELIDRIIHSKIKKVSQS